MQNNPKIESEQFPDVERDNWSVENISEEAANESSDEILRKILRGDETEGDADERDIAGGVESADTPHGSEEIKTNIKENNT